MIEKRASSTVSSQKKLYIYPIFYIILYIFVRYESPITFPLHILGLSIGKYHHPPFRQILTIFLKICCFLNIFQTIILDIF